MRVRSVLKWFVLALVLVPALMIGWLRWSAGQPKAEWFDDRQGRVVDTEVEQTLTEFGQLSQYVNLEADTGLWVSFRVIRDTETSGRMPVYLVLGGHRTGEDAVDLFGEVSGHAIVGIDYSYEGPEKARGFIEVARTIPLARKAILDTIPAVSLVVDWLHEQDWVDPSRVFIIGASLGAPFAVSAAARDERIRGAVIVHGAADNHVWLEVQIARRVDAEILHYPLATVLFWLAHGQSLNSSENIAAVSPRPVLIIGARDDERTPASQVQLLYDAAGDPKRLRWTDGRHVQPNRQEIVEELLRIADEEMPFLRREEAQE